MNYAYEMLKDYVPVKTALKTRREGDMLIASNESGQIYYLNETGAYIWQIIDETSNIENLRQKISDEYKADPERIKEDIINFIRDMQWKKLLRLKEVKKES